MGFGFVQCTYTYRGYVKDELSYLPEVVNLAVDERLILPLDVINVFDVAGIKVLLHHKAQEAVVWRVSCHK